LSKYYVIIIVYLFNCYYLFGYINNIVYIVWIFIKSVYNRWVESIINW